MSDQLLHVSKNLKLSFENYVVISQYNNAQKTYCKKGKKMPFSYRKDKKVTMFIKRRRITCHVTPVICMYQNVTTSQTVITRTIPSIFALDFQKEV